MSNKTFVKVVYYYTQNMDSSLYLLGLNSTNNSSCGSSLLSVVENEKMLSMNYTKHNNITIQRFLFEKSKAMEHIHLDE